MIKKLTFPFRLTITELKKDNAFRKTIVSKTIKMTVLGFMWQSCIFFMGFSFMYYGIVYITIATFITREPVLLIFFIGFLLLLLFFKSLFKNLHPKVKKNYLKRKNVYEKYLEITKDIG